MSPLMGTLEMICLVGSFVYFEEGTNAQTPIALVIFHGMFTTHETLVQ